MSQATAILGLVAETSVHAGEGQKLGAVDLPIQREAHTNWPCIYGTGVKGALRARAGELGLDPNDVAVAFGPDTRSGDEHGGALAVGDARLLLLPVRSLLHPFLWVTCPAVLERLQRDLRRLGLSQQVPIPEVSGEAAVLDLERSQEPSAETHLYLEELRLRIERTDLEALAKCLIEVAPLEDADLVRGRCAVVSDELFQFLVSSAIPVAAHVTIDNARKTAKEGGLRYEESLPPETVLYTPLVASRSAKAGTALAGEAILSRILTGLFGKHPYVQIGGNETVGMGWFRVLAHRRQGKGAS